MNPPPIQWIPVFEAAAKFKNFRKAADELNVSQPAVSQQIKALENYLGIKLFRRRGPILELTEAGEFYYHCAIKTVASHVRGFEEFDRLFNKRSLRLNTPLFIAQEILIPNYLGFKSLEPKAELRITTGTEYVDFDSGIADAAIRFGLGDWPSLFSRKLCAVTSGLVCSPSYEAQHGVCGEEDIDSELNQHTLISTREDLNDWKYFFPNLAPKDVIVCDSYFSAINSAEKGLGISLGIFPAVNNWVNTNRLKLITNKFYKTDAAYWLVYPKHQADNDLIDSCFSWSKALFDSLPELKV